MPSLLWLPRDRVSSRLTSHLINLHSPIIWKEIGLAGAGGLHAAWGRATRVFLALWGCARRTGTALVCQIRCELTSKLPSQQHTQKRHLPKGAVRALGSTNSSASPATTTHLSQCWQVCLHLSRREMGVSGVARALCSGLTVEPWIGLQWCRRRH